MRSRSHGRTGIARRLLATLPKRETRELDLPGRIVLAHGIPIKRPTARSVEKRADHRRLGEADHDSELLEAIAV